MIENPVYKLQEYRAIQFRLNNPIKSLQEAIDFVNERGALFFWPIKDIVFPSLWVAVAGDRPVPNEHDDPAHITWNWKDTMLGKKGWYYAKILRKKSTLLSLEIAPYYYALSDNYGDPEEDYLTAYHLGKLSSEAKRIYEAILDHGPLDTISLKQKAHLTSPGYESRFNHALACLQADFKIVPMGISEAGPWHYAFIYDLTFRQFPQIIENSRWISPLEARQKILMNYFRSVGYAKFEWLQKIFQWDIHSISTALTPLINSGSLKISPIMDLTGEWIILSEIDP